MSPSPSPRSLPPLRPKCFAAQEDAAGGPVAAAGGFGGSQSFGASSQSQSVAPLSSYGK
ncbi:Hypothetical protein FKW44_008175 [Caligus rogercresseyi]|uniref:Uncharacterized protein n=1 Tax=Caligus rogercresseyi TaxID=217165 RepID=A0A7T8KFS3_CALRO|nr:Hypothetical protein FKW44_008175 [Caligus rogercresseyi]